MVAILCALLPRSSTTPDFLCSTSSTLPTAVECEYPNLYVRSEPSHSLLGRVSSAALSSSRVHADFCRSTSWPAVWTADPSDWPGNGEIDVVETVNQGDSGVQMALHTSKKCTMNVRRVQSGTVNGNNCYNGTNNNAGCAVTGSPSSYGAEANEDGGNVSVQIDSKAKAL